MVVAVEAASPVENCGYAGPSSWSPTPGTTTLAAALTELGFDHTYHGDDTMAFPADCVNWCELLDSKQRGRSLDAEAFDSVIGHCQAVTDTPCCNFAEELIKAYPKAQIIINYRPDLDAWNRSITNTILKADDTTTFAKVLCLFHPKLFWMRQRYSRMDKAVMWRGDIARHTKTVYRDHYRRLEQISPPERTLCWTVEDGWEPLCRFLNKPVPDKPFPTKNNPEEFAKNISRKFDPMVQRAFINIGVCLAGLGLVIAWIVSRG